jgi:hypothetical protein
MSMEEVARLKAGWSRAVRAAMLWARDADA